VGATHDPVHFSVERCHGVKKSNRCGNGEEHVESERLAVTSPPPGLIGLIAYLYQ
jgi:hypothetical protein